MPFVSRAFILDSGMPAFVFVKRTLGCCMRQAQRVIDKGRLYDENHRPLAKSAYLPAGMRVFLDIFEPSGEIKPFFLHQDFALFDKPNHLLTHPKGRFFHPSLCDSIKASLGLDANPVHRLDFETSGIVLASLNKKSEVILKTEFEKGRVDKVYLALVHGILQEDIRINLPILRPSKQQKGEDLGIRCRVDARGKEAVSEVLVLGHMDGSGNFSGRRIQKLSDLENLRALELFDAVDFIKLEFSSAQEASHDGYTLVAVRLLHGRTHQIRLHLSYIHHPVVNEPLYGEDSKARAYLDSKLTAPAKALRLHAFGLGFTYQGRRFEFYVPLPKDFFSQMI